MEYVSLVSELNYMTQIVVMLYEDPTKEDNSEERFHVELHFSPGVNCCVQKDLPPGPGFRPHSRNNEQVRKGWSSSLGLSVRGRFKKGKLVDFSIAGWEGSRESIKLKEVIFSIQFFQFLSFPVLKFCQFCPSRPRWVGGVKV